MSADSAFYIVSVCNHVDIEKKDICIKLGASFSLMESLQRSKEMILWQQFMKT